MLSKTKAIVLHSFKYGESQVIVDVLTEEHGRLSCIVRISKTAKGGMRKQYFQPLFIIEAVIDIRPSTRLHKIKEARIASPFRSIPFDPFKLSVAMFTAEFILNATKREQTDRMMFAYIENGIEWLDGCEGSIAGFHLVFMMRLSRFLGFYPNIEGYMPGDWFDMRAASFCRTAPLHHDRLVPEDARKISLMLRMNFPTMHLFKMSHDERNRMADIIIRYYRLHLPDFAEIRSLPVLKELFV